MLSLLTDPETFFEERELGLVGPLLVVAAVMGLAFVAGVGGVVVAVDMAPYTTPEDPMGPGADDPFAPDGQDPAEAQPIDPGDMAAFMAVFGGIGLVLGLVWLALVFLFYAGSFYGLTAVFDGEGSFADTLAVVGWGFAPKILAEAVGVVAAVYTGIVWMMSERPAQGEMVDPIIGPVGTFFLGLVTIGALFWSAYIWYFGIKKVRNVDATGAAVSVGLPVFVAFVFNLVALVLSVIGAAGAGGAA